MLITIHQIGSWREVVHVDSRNGNRMDQARILVYACVDFHPEIPLIALLGLVHF